MVAAVHSKGWCQDFAFGILCLTTWYATDEVNTAPLAQIPCAALTQSMQGRQGGVKEAYEAQHLQRERAINIVNAML